MATNIADHESTLGLKKCSHPESRDTFRRGSIARIARSVARQILYFPDRHVGWAFKASHSALDDDWHPDVILATGPPFSSFLSAASIARRVHAPWIADYRDLWTTSTYYPYSRLRQLFERLLERWIVASAASAVTVSSPLRRDLERIIGIPVNVVMNGADPRPGAACHSPVSGEFRIVYTGQIYEGRRDPSPLLRAVQATPGALAEVRIHFAGPNTGVAMSIARRLGCEEYVVDHGNIAYEESIDLQMTADILLLLMWNNPGEEGVYSGKLFEYLLAKRPILMLGYEDGVAAALLNDRLAGVVLNQPDEIAAFLMAKVEQKRQHGSVASLPEDVFTGLTRSAANIEFERIIVRAAGMRLAR